MKKLSICISIFLLCISSCFRQESKVEKPSILGDSNGHHFWDGELPFYQRKDIKTAYIQLQTALSNIRSRIDIEFGKKEWKLIDPAHESFSYCKDRSKEGEEDTSMQGAIYGVEKENYERILHIVKEKLQPYGFTKIIDVSDVDLYGTNIHNVKDGGYVGITLNKSKSSFAMSYTTGCRPSSGSKGGGESSGEGGRSSASNGAS